MQLLFSTKDNRLKLGCFKLGPGLCLNMCSINQMSRCIQHFELSSGHETACRRLLPTRANMVTSFRANRLLFLVPDSKAAGEPHPKAKFSACC